MKLNWFWSRWKVHFSILIWHRTAARFNFGNRRDSIVVGHSRMRSIHLFSSRSCLMISPCDTPRIYIHSSIVELLLKFIGTEFDARIKTKGDCHRCHWQRTSNGRSFAFHTLDLRRRTGAILYDIWTLKFSAPSEVRTEVIKFVIEISNEKCRTRTVKHLCGVVKWMFSPKVNKWHAKKSILPIEKKAKNDDGRKFRFDGMAKKRAIEQKIEISAKDSVRWMNGYAYVPKQCEIDL